MVGQTTTRCSTTSCGRGKGKDGGPLKWKDFSEKLVSGCWGPDQVYYKYKTDFWREGGGFPTPSGKFEFHSNHLESLGYDPPAGLQRAG